MGSIRSLALVAILALVPTGLVLADDETPDGLAGLDSILAMLEGSDGVIAQNAVVSVRAFTMNADGEMVEIENPDMASLPGGACGIGGLSEESLALMQAQMQEAFEDLMDDFDDLDVEDLGDLENLDFEALGLGPIDLEALQGDIDLADFDFENGSIMGLDLGGVDCGEMQIFNPDDLPPGLQQALENLEDVDLSSLGDAVVSQVAQVSAYAMGPDGQLVELDGDFDLESFLGEIESILGDNVEINVQVDSDTEVGAEGEE